MKKMIFWGLLVAAFLLCAVVLYRGSRTETYDLDFPEEGLQVWTDMEKAPAFVSNGKAQVYSRRDELDGETLFAEYVADWDEPILAYDYTPVVVTLSQPLYYYAAPGDTKPALTLEAGKQYVVYSGYMHGAFFWEKLWGFGYGLKSWPTYEKGWRYAAPFVPVEEYESACSGTYESPGCYYVGLGDLKRVVFQEPLLMGDIKENGDTSGMADARIAQGGDYGISMGKDFLYFADAFLYSGGEYESPDYEYPPLNLARLRHRFDIWDGICILLSGGSLTAAGAFLFHYKKKSREVSNA